MIKAIRGAVSIEFDDEKSIGNGVSELYSEILKRNSLNESDIICVNLSQTKDIRSFNSASALRKNGFCSDTPLFCTQEADVENAMPMVIRMMILTENLNEKAKHVYLGRTAELRPDISKT